MPAWLIQLLISLAIKIGLPALIKYIPQIPSEVVQIIEELLNNLKKPDVSNSAAKKTAQLRVREAMRSKL